MNTDDAMLAIQECLDGVEWNADTIKQIAEIMELAGYTIRDTEIPVLDLIAKIEAELASIIADDTQ